VPQWTPIKARNEEALDHVSIGTVRIALGSDTIQEDQEGLKIYLEAKSSPPDIALVEEFYAGRRRDLALLRGHDLFSYPLRFLGDPLEAW
jgi:hypothetical protein